MGGSVCFPGSGFDFFFFFFCFFFFLCSLAPRIVHSLLPPRIGRRVHEPLSGASTCSFSECSSSCSTSARGGSDTGSALSVALSSAAGISVNLWPRGRIQETGRSGWVALTREDTFGGYATSVKPQASTRVSLQRCLDNAVLAVSHNHRDERRSPGCVLLLHAGVPRWPWAIVSVDVEQLYTRNTGH